MRSTCVQIIVSLVVVLMIVSCQSKQEKNASSEQSNDSVFVFSTPKVLNVGAVIDKHFKFGTPQEREIGLIIPFDIVDSTGFLSLSDVADDVEYVLLKTSNANQEVFIGKAQNVFLCKDYIFVQLNDNIIQYDRQGNLIRTIGRKGRGPGEYNWVFNMTVDDQAKRILISDTSGMINEYDFEGKFIRSQKSTYDDQLMPIDSDRIAVVVKNVWHDVKERLVILNRKGEVEKSFPRYQLFEHTDYGKSSGFSPSLTKFQDIICFNEAYNDTIFELKNDELQMRYYLDFGKYAMKPEYYYKNDIEKMRGKITYSYYESNRFLIIPSSIGFDFTVVYDKKNDQIRIAFLKKLSNPQSFYKNLGTIENGFSNDMDGGIAHEVDAISNDSKYIVSYYYASDIKDYFEEAGYGANPKYPDKQAKLKELVDTIDENKHNLFIMMSKLKE